MRPNWPFKGWFTKIISEKKGEGWEWPPQPPLNPKHTHALLSFFFFKHFAKLFMFSQNSPAIIFGGYFLDAGKSPFESYSEG